MKRTRGLGVVYQRGGVFRVSYSVRGVRHRESSGSEMRTDAVRLLKQRIKEVGNGQPVGRSVDRTTLAEILAMVADDYKINGRRLTPIKSPAAYLLNHFGEAIPVLDITGDAVARFVAARLEAGSKHGTINRILALLKRAFALGIRAGKVAQRPHIAMLEENNARQGFVTPGDFERLREALPADLRDPVGFLYYSAWRVGEMRTLQWRDVDLEGRAIRLARAQQK